MVEPVERAAVAEPVARRGGRGRTGVVAEPVEAAAVAEPVVAPEAVVAEAAVVPPEAVVAEPVAPPEAVAVEQAVVSRAGAVRRPPLAEPVVPSPGARWLPSRAPAAANPWDGEMHAGAEALGSGDALLAALHFAVALRTSPEAARAVLDGIGERADLALELVRGDALRLLGNDSDAEQAYASVASRLSMSKPGRTEPAPAPAAPSSQPSLPHPSPHPSLPGARDPGEHRRATALDQVGVRSRRR